MLIPAQLHLTLPSWIHDRVDAQSSYPDDASRVELAIALAGWNIEAGTGGPFGAAIFTADGRLISVGVNRVVPQTCSVAHAEMMAFMTAQQRLQQFRLNDIGQRIILATSAQPCCQCYGASIWAGIDEMLIGARSSDVESLTGFDEGPLPEDWIGELEKRGIRVSRDLQREAACAVLRRYGEQEGVVY